MRKKWKKILKVVLAVFGCVLIVDAALVLGFAYAPANLDKADAVVVLGAAIKTKRIYYRALEGLRLYKEGDAPLIVLSGGYGEGRDISEAEYMQNIITANYSAAIPIILETGSHSTYENLANVKAEVADLSSIIIVSDNYHLARSVLMAKALGFKKVYWSHPPEGHYSKSETIYYLLREMAAMVAYVPKFIFR